MISRHIFSCQLLSYFQHFLGYESIFDLGNQLINVDNMKLFFVRWTGANLGQSLKQINSVRNLFSENNTMLSQVRILTVRY